MTRKEKTKVDELIGLEKTKITIDVLGQFFSLYPAFGNAMGALGDSCCSNTSENNNIRMVCDWLDSVALYREKCLLDELLLNEVCLLKITGNFVRLLEERKAKDPELSKLADEAWPRLKSFS